MTINQKDKKEIEHLVKSIVSDELKTIEQRIHEHSMNSEKHHREILNKIEPLIDGIKWVNTTKTIVTFISTVGASLLIIWHWFVR